MLYVFSAQSLNMTHDTFINIPFDKIILLTEQLYHESGIGPKLGFPPFSIYNNWQLRKKLFKWDFLNFSRVHVVV